MKGFFGSTSAIALVGLALVAAIVFAVVLDFEKTRRGEAAGEVEKAEIAKTAQSKADKRRERALQNAREILSSQAKAEAELTLAKRIEQLEKELAAAKPPRVVGGGELFGGQADEPDADEKERRAFLDKENATEKQKRDRKKIQQFLVDMDAAQGRNAGQARAAIGAFGQPKPRITPNWRLLTGLFGKPAKPPRKFTEEELAAAAARRAQEAELHKLKLQWAARTSVNSRGSIIATGASRAAANDDAFKARFKAGVQRATP